MSQPPRRPIGQAEFAETIGEKQAEGSRRVLGLPTYGAGSVVPAAASVPMQVLSTFDTRPIDAYDFAMESDVNLGDASIGGGSFEDSLAVPDQYTAVLRQVEFEFNPMFIGSADGQGSNLSIWLTRDSVPIPNNTIVFGGSYSSYVWNTHQVFGYTHSFGIGGFANFIDPPPVSYGYIKVRYFGTLLLSRGRPAAHEIGSPPVFTRGPIK